MPCSAPSSASWSVPSWARRARPTVPSAPSPPPWPRRGRTGRAERPSGQGRAARAGGSDRGFGSTTACERGSEVSEGPQMCGGIFIFIT